MVTARPLTVEVVGFSPGFAYLAGLPAALRHVPRRARPRPSVPAGSVALANGHAAVYPSASPGGWQLIGHTDEPLFTPWTPPYARLTPGDRVRFVRATTATGHDTGRPTSSAAPIPGAEAPPSGARPGLRGRGARPPVRPAGRGRKGVAALGVPAAGPADPDSFRLANAAGRQPGRRLRPRDHGARPDPALPEPDLRGGRRRLARSAPGRSALGAGPRGARHCRPAAARRSGAGRVPLLRGDGRRLRRSRPARELLQRSAGRPRARADRAGGATVGRPHGAALGRPSARRCPGGCGRRASRSPCAWSPVRTPSGSRPGRSPPWRRGDSPSRGRATGWDCGSGATRARRRCRQLPAPRASSTPRAWSPEPCRSHRTGSRSSC